MPTSIQRRSARALDITEWFIGPVSRSSDRRNSVRNGESIFDELRYDKGMANDVRVSYTTLRIYAFVISRWPGIMVNAKERCSRVIFDSCPLTDRS